MSVESPKAAFSSRLMASTPETGTALYFDTVSNCNARYTGTIGILKACCQSSMINPDDADHLLANVIRHGFYSPVTVP